MMTAGATSLNGPVILNRPNHISIKGSMAAGITTPSGPAMTVNLNIISYSIYQYTYIIIYIIGTSAHQVLMNAHQVANSIASISTQSQSKSPTYIIHISHHMMQKHIKCICIYIYMLDKIIIITMTMIMKMLDAFMTMLIYIYIYIYY